MKKLTWITMLLFLVTSLSAFAQDDRNSPGDHGPGNSFVSSSRSCDQELGDNDLVREKLKEQIQKKLKHKIITKLKDLKVPTKKIDLAVGLSSEYIKADSYARTDLKVWSKIVTEKTELKISESLGLLDKRFKIIEGYHSHDNSIRAQKIVKTDVEGVPLSAKCKIDFKLKAKIINTLYRTEVAVLSDKIEMEFPISLKTKRYERDSNIDKNPFVVTASTSSEEDEEDYLPKWSCYATPRSSIKTKDILGGEYVRTAWGKTYRSNDDRKKLAKKAAKSKCFRKEKQTCKVVQCENNDTGLVSQYY